MTTLAAILFWLSAGGQDILNEANQIYKAK